MTRITASDRQHREQNLTAAARQSYSGVKVIHSDESLSFTVTKQGRAIADLPDVFVAKAFPQLQAGSPDNAKHVENAVARVLRATFAKAYAGVDLNTIDLESEGWRRNQDVFFDLGIYGTKKPAGLSRRLEA